MNIMNVLPTRRYALGLVVAAGFVALSVVACGGKPDVEELPHGDPIVDQVLLKGHAVYGHEVRSVRPCGEEESVWAIDTTQLLWELHGELAPGIEPYEEVFVVVRGSEGAAPSDGFGANYPGSFVVDQVLYAAGEGFGCDMDLRLFHYRLSGNEPFWTLSIADATGELSRMDAPGLVWSDLRSEMTGVGIKYMSDGSESGSLEIFIHEEPCRDSMSGAYHGYSASVSMADETLYGCAIHGSRR
jgi:putative lipoprotein